METIKMKKDAWYKLICEGQADVHPNPFPETTRWTDRAGTVVAVADKGYMTSHKEPVFTVDKGFYEKTKANTNARN